MIFEGDDDHYDEDDDVEELDGIVHGMVLGASPRTFLFFLTTLMNFEGYFYDDLETASRWIAGTWACVFRDFVDGGVRLLLPPSPAPCAIYPTPSQKSAPRRIPHSRSQAPCRHLLGVVLSILFPMRVSNERRAPLLCLPMVCFHSRNEDQEHTQELL